MTLATGWQWFKTGFVRYRRNPVLMVFWVMSYWTMLGLVGLVPVVGDLLVAELDQGATRLAGRRPHNQLVIVDADGEFSQHPGQRLCPADDLRFPLGLLV